MFLRRMSTFARKITHLSVTSPPTFTTSETIIDPFISSRKNVLSIDLFENQTHFPRYSKQLEEPREDLTSDSVRVELEAFKASQGPVHILDLGWRPFRATAEILERNVLLIHRIRNIVSEDAAKQPEDRIDCIEIGPEPWPEHLRALDGLSPKHLRVDAGFTEEIDVFELDKLNTKFKLDSLYFTNVSENWSEPIPTSHTNLSSESFMDPKLQYNDRFPEFFSHVRSLSLEYCYSISFEGTNLPTHLRQLRIIGNNAMDMFISAVDNIPNANEQLEKVLIYTDPCFDMSLAFRTADFRERLGRCKGLKELTLVVADDDDPETRATRWKSSDLDHFDVGLSKSLPNSIERLEFHCSNSESMLADLDLWLEAAKDPEWLPRLKYIHICTYEAGKDKFRLRDKRMRTVDEGRDRMFLEKIQKVYEALKSRILSPFVEVGH